MQESNTVRLPKYPPHLWMHEIPQLKNLTAETNTILVNSGLLPSNIGYFATTVNPIKVNTIKKRRNYLERVNMDIVFGDCVDLGRHRYALLLVDVATRYCWLYGMSSLSSMSITSALEQFKAGAGCQPHRFHSDFDRKLIGENDLRWIISNGSNIISAPTGSQSTNGLEECTWHTLIQTSREFIT